MDTVAKEDLSEKVMFEEQPDGSEDARQAEGRGQEGGRQGQVESDPGRGPASAKALR